MWANVAIDMVLTLAWRHMVMSKGAMGHKSDTHVAHIKGLSLVLSALNGPISFPLH